MEIDIAPIEPSVFVQPWPLWVMIPAGIAALLLLIALGYGVVVLWRRMTAKPPLTPRQIALQDLAVLAPELPSCDPHVFSVDVSDILRAYVTREYHIPATSQTSPEFLATVTRQASFPEDDQELLKAFLEKADLIKFAHLEATAADSEILLEQARKFVQGKGGQTA